MEGVQRRGRRCLGRKWILHIFYLVGIWFKGIDGLVEIAGGILFLVVSKAALVHFAQTLIHTGILGSADGWIALHLGKVLAHISTGTKVFGSIYLLAHGLIKVGLVWGGLLQRKMWAFPTAIAVLTAFIGYQIYRILERSSTLLMALTLIDFIVSS